MQKTTKKEGDNKKSSILETIRNTKRLAITCSGLWYQQKPQ